MTIYICLFLSQLILWIIARRTNKHRLCLLISLALLFVVSSFRASTMGTDYSEYVTVYNHVASGHNYDMEIGYIIMNWLVSRIILSHVGLAMGVNLMLMIPFFIFVTKNVPSKYWGLCTLIFTANPYLFVQGTFNILRQSCATGMILLATHFFVRKKWLRGFVFIFIAILFHNIAIVALCIPLFLFLNFNKGLLLGILCFSYVTGFVLGDKLIAIMAKLLSFGSYATYEASVFDNPIYTAFIFVFALILLNYRDKCVETDIQRKFYDLYLISLSLFFFAFKNDMVYRTYLIFVFVTLPAIPIVWRKFDNLVRLGYFGYYTVFYFGYLIVVWSGDIMYVPFKFCF